MQFFERFLNTNTSSSQHRLKIKWTADQDCFVRVPEFVARTFQDQPAPVVLALSHGGSACHVAMSAKPCYGRDTLEITAAMGKCLSLQEGLQVTVKLPQKVVPDATALTVKPESVDEWETVELHQQEIIDNLLRQGAVLEVGQKFPFWLGNRRPIILVVTSAEPEAVVRPRENLEMFVEPQPREQDFEAEEETDGPAVAKKVTWLRALAGGSNKQQLEDRLQSNSLASARDDTTSVRMHPQTALYCGFQRSGELVAVASSPYKSKLALMLLLDDSIPQFHAQIAAPVLTSLQLGHYHSIAFWSIPQKERLPHGLLLHAISSSRGGLTSRIRSMNAKDLRSRFCTWLDQQMVLHCQASKQADYPKGVPVTDGSIIKLAYGQDATYYFVETTTDNSHGQKPKTLAILTRNKMESADGPEMKIETGEPIQLPGWPADNFAMTSETAVIDDTLQAPHFGKEWSRKYLHTCLQKALPQLHHSSRNKWWKLHPPTPGGVLITGPAGSGKTSLVSHLARTVASHPESLAHKVYLDCQTVDIETLANARKQLESTLQEAVSHMPSVLVFDNLHMLCPAENPAPEQMAANSGAAALVQWLCEVLDYFSQQPHGRPPLPVFTVATCPNASDLAPALRAAGRLEQVIKLDSLGLAERESLLGHAISQRSMTCSTSLIREAAVRAEGHDAADLQALADRAVHSAVRRRIVQTELGIAKGEVVRADMEAAWQDFNPASSWGVGKGSGGRMVSGWEDVGGMNDVRDALKEALELPTKYSRLLSRAPLRLRTGVLLYGPPGCGKTHIISAAVAASGTRFVSVKGPELLNKYIGASESAVRDLFRQASAAAPCVLFFDEFDAIAPKRGHDSTGVTDRVVNQLLTELDGVEGLKGVVVLAATSRPDLLDAALLRPGRLDRLMFCGMPSLSERIEILKALSRNILLSDSINLAQVAALCEGYTGADLGAVLSDAQMEAVHQLLEKADPAAPKKSALHKVSADNLRTALQKSRPSLSAAEHQRLMKVYNKFQAGRSTTSPAENQHERPMLRATLG